MGKSTEAQKLSEQSLVQKLVIASCKAPKPVQTFKTILSESYGKNCGSMCLNFSIIPDEYHGAAQRHQDSSLL